MLGGVFVCDSTGGECWEVSLSVIALVVSVERCLCDSTGTECWEVSLSVIALVVSVERCLCL